MITAKPLLSENVKDFMDFALDAIKSMDGAPEHNTAEQAVVNAKIVKLKEYLEVVSVSYNETTPKIIENPSGQSTGNFSGTGHS
ncbi:hypothetical protein [Pedobacter mendelii]|uniref:Uncharacterized protein n=1 Tax=Pedobacter mendelii TaxID=1908240 RepID=A0ABQ2BKQ5_9SPHI|nr:hypothetical protein [Pedobacter mendelii]GGI28193.1 hypothetical protein GCM10008119_31420 [Pedobacter mendelii]